jgi:hypothetical protein
MYPVFGTNENFEAPTTKTTLRELERGREREGMTETNTLLLAPSHFCAPGQSSALIFADLALQYNPHRNNLTVKI